MSERAGRCGDQRHDQRHDLRQGQPPSPDRRLGLHLPRLSRAAAADPQVRRSADRRRRRVLQHAVEIHRGSARRRRADPCRGDLRPLRPHLPQRHLRRLQGEPPRPARGAEAPVPADPRRDPRLQPALHRDRGVRGRRHHRGAVLPGARRGRARHHHQLGQGPDAAGGRRRRDAGPDQEQGDRPRRGVREVRCLPRTRGGRAGACGRPDRQRARRARYRDQDRRPADPGIRRPGNAARPRGRDQAAQAPPDADRPRRPDPHLEAPRQARLRHGAGFHAGQPRGSQPRRASPDRLSEPDGVPHAHHPRGRTLQGPAARGRPRCPGRRRPRRARVSAGGLHGLCHHPRRGDAADLARRDPPAGVGRAGYRDDQP